MPSWQALSVWGPGQRQAARAAAVALRDAGVEVQVGATMVCLLLRHVLEVYLKHNQQINKVLCVVGSDANSHKLLVFGRVLETAGVELQLVATDPALCKTLGAQPALPGRLRGVQLVLAGDVAPEILEKVRSLTEKATVHPGPGFPRALATAQSWDAMGKPKGRAPQGVASPSALRILADSAATSIVKRGPSTRSVYPSRAKRPARFRAAWAGRSSSAAKADDNRSKQLNPQDPTYHASRGEAPAAAAAAAAAATQANQEKK